MSWMKTHSLEARGIRLIARVEFDLIDPPVIDGIKHCCSVVCNEWVPNPEPAHPLDFSSLHHSHTAYFATNEEGEQFHAGLAPSMGARLLALTQTPEGE